jgi:hypothetical protein
LERIERDISLTSLDRADVSPVKLCPLGQVFLGDSELVAKSADVLSDDGIQAIAGHARIIAR